MRTRIKMCGMTRSEDVEAACQAGADAIGMIFYPPSGRYIEVSQAEKLAQHVSLAVDKVALFVNPEVNFVNDVVAATGADILQFHGDESAEFCQQFGRRYIKALRVKSAAEVAEKIAEHHQADAIMLDAYVKGVPGGTGQQFDWSMTPESIRHKLFLAGGLNADNVGTAIQALRPYAVDVAGGIEQAPGIKDIDKIFAFAEAVRQADALFIENSS
ncbi:phosphoribosylanthranilate isomerase [Reinekea thalattae]|uniref:N-(5'-phosphoribosyl)anthranilate isomerase n=1 Tax=Reinekea thalattae TaxID=2593301 RepID=A0A5C8ZDS6_9GAMM|nr:phosphoribosylanthranilate isomerase [Reinekea thalattae]TXR54950.1 phosphoribosylanthranilate isomerase [Reinekea thalattae]